MKKKQFLTLGIMLTACMLFAGGQKEIDTSWYKDYTEEEKKLVEKYEFENSDLSDYYKIDSLLNDVADINLYGNTMDSIHKVDRTGYMRDVYDDPLHVLDYYDSYIDSLTYDEISKKWFISKEAYNEWILDSMWSDSLKQTEEIKHAAECRFYTDFALTDIYSMDQMNSLNAYEGFTDKLHANRNGLVGKTVVLDVLSFAEYVLDCTDNPVFSISEFHEIIKDRLEDDKAAIVAENITVDHENQAIIDDFSANLERYSNILYREHWFDETYVSYYYQPVPVIKYIGIRDWDLGVGASLGYGFSGLTLTGYLKNWGITGYFGNHCFRPNVSFGMGIDYNWQVCKGSHFGIGINTLLGFDIVEKYSNSNSNSNYDPFYPNYNNGSYNNSSSSYPNYGYSNGYNNNSYVGNDIYNSNTSNTLQKESRSEFVMALEFPISYKYFFQNKPLMFTATTTLTVISGYEEPTVTGGFTIGLQYLAF